MINLQRFINRKLGRLSREGIIGIGLFVLCIIFYLSTLRPAQLQQGQLQNSVESLQEKITNAVHPTHTNNDSLTDQLADYYKFFPAQTTTPEWLDKIYDAANSQGIKLREGEYRVNQEQAGRLIRYQITLPAKGTYFQLRRFLATVLSEIPIASLDQINFERQKIGDVVVSAQIKLSLYLEQQ